MDVFKVANLILILIFILGIGWIVGIYVVGGYIYPMFEHLAPSSNSTGISQSQYSTTTSHLYKGLRWFFYILIAIPFVYVIMKLLYKKEEVSVYYGGYT